VSDIFFRELCKIFAAHLQVDVSCIKQEPKLQDYSKLNCGTILYSACIACLKFAICTTIETICLPKS
jgi:hypothetical protein